MTSFFFELNIWGKITPITSVTSLHILRRCGDADSGGPRDIAQFFDEESKSGFQPQQASVHIHLCLIESNARLRVKV